MPNDAYTSNIDPNRSMRYRTNMTNFADNPHRKSWDIPWDSHLLTFSCFNRRPFFRSNRACGWFLENLISAQRKAPFDLWGYVLMPEHVHLLILPADGVKMSAILYTLKQPVTIRAITYIRRHTPTFLRRMEDTQPNGKVAYRFWQRGGGYDRNLRAVSDVHEKLKYLHENPVRRGLVSCAEDYHWSSARAWLTGDDGDVPVNRGSFPPMIQ
ncbi:MAG: hypothetical protein K8S55_01375 [Phycisphaerae bacterium]|nr:hypothetical protein [Phycisphaerae bacterium]